jgi:hypothetical protein
LGPLGQGLLDPSGIRVVGQLKQGLVSIAPSGFGGRDTLAGERGVCIESQFNEGTYTVLLFIYMYFVYETIVSNIRIKDSFFIKTL